MLINRCNKLEQLIAIDTQANQCNKVNNLFMLVNIFLSQLNFLIQFSSSKFFTRKF